MNISVMAQRQLDGFVQTINVVARNVEDSNNTRLAIESCLSEFEIMRNMSAYSHFDIIEEVKSPSIKENNEVGQKCNIYFHVIVNEDTLTQPKSALLFCKDVTIGWEAILTAMDATFEIMCPNLAILTPTVYIDSIMVVIQ